MTPLAMEEMISYRRAHLQRLARPRRQSDGRPGYVTGLRHAAGGWLIRVGRVVDVPLCPDTRAAH